MAPAGLAGSVSPIRIAPSVLARRHHSCATYLAVKSRPALKPLGWPHLDKPPVPIRCVMDVLDTVEFQGRSAEDALASVIRDQTLSLGVEAFVRTAVDGYLAAVKSSPRMVPVPFWWVIQYTDQGVRELWTWGRRYRSDDGSARELRLLRLGNAVAARSRSEPEIAVAAYTAARGRPALWPQEWSQKFTVRAAEAVTRVVVADIDLTAGTRSVLFDGGIEEATALYERAGRPAASQVINGRTRQVGGDCFKCRLLLSCGEVVRAPGLLGLRSYTRAAVRQISISDLRYYADCPAQYRLRALRLPKTNEYAMPARLGQAVHHFLETRHATAAGPCGHADMPAGDDWADPRWDLDAEAAETGRHMLSYHPIVCPLMRGTSEIAIEKTFVFHDTAAQALVIAKPDLVYRDAGAWVWRETKTTSRPHRPSEDIMVTYPQVALATVILGRGLLGGPVDGARVELEVLRPTAPDLITVDPADPKQLEAALAVLRGLAEPWRTDTSFAAAPGRKCHTCPVSRWCPSAARSTPPEATQETDRGNDPEQSA
jgi:hypothetical protein